VHGGGAERRQVEGAAEVGDVVHVDARAARVAASQAGLVARGDLAAVGLGRGAIAHRVAVERLHRVHRGIYLLGHSVGPAGADARAAVLACGRHAYLSHRSALEQYGIVDPAGGDVHVTVVRGRRRSRKGIRAHRTTRIAPEDLGLLDGDLRITSPARAILDYAEQAPRAELARAVNEAHVQRLALPDDLRAVLARTPGRRGARTLRAVLDRNDGPVLLHRGLEEVAYMLFDGTPIPQPLVNHSMFGWEYDLVWLKERVIVELDGGRFHGTPAAVNRDRRKEADARRHDFELIRYSWWQIDEESHFVVAEVAAALERRRSPARA
jgi:predicted transcriptional regulator of viral defense system